MKKSINDEVEIKLRRLVAENTKFNLYFEHIVDHMSGEDVPNFLVVEPKARSDKMVTGVAILPIYNEQVGLVRIYRPPLRSWCYEIPHGFIEPGESDEMAACRELLEETGMHAQRVVDLGYIAPDAGIIAGKVHLYLVNPAGLLSAQTLEVGLREFCWVPQAKFESMLADSSIQDSFTLSAWCRYLINKAA